MFLTLIFTRGVDSLKRAVESFSTILYEGAVQPGDVCLSLPSNSIHKQTHDCVYVPVYTGMWLSEITSENLACARGSVKKNGETFTMGLSLQGLYQFLYMPFE